MKRNLLLSMMLLWCWTVMAQWSSDPATNNRVVPARNIYDSQFEVNKDGIIYLCYNAPKGGTTVTFLQILDKEGKKLLPEEGKVIASERTRSYTVINDLIMVDNDGNALLAVSDCRNSPSDVQNLSYTIYKVSPTGELLWGEEGVDLNRGHAYDLVAKMCMIQLEDGSYMFAWEKSLGRDESGNEILSIQMERLSKDGDFLWDTPLELEDDAISYLYPYLVNAGNNQAILVYAYGGLLSNQVIMARKIDFDGTSVWGKDTRIYRGGFPAIPLHIILNVIPDQKGGAFVGWYDDRLFTQRESTYISHIKSDGSLTFPEGEEGLKVGYTDILRSFRPEMLYREKDDCIYVIWRETDAINQSHRSLLMQKVAMSGELLWDPAGIEIVPLQNEYSLNSYSIQDAGGDGDFAVFYIKGFAYGDAVPCAMKYNSEGEALWDKELIFSTYTSEKGKLQVSPLIEGNHWIASWSDGRDGFESTIYMQYITSDAGLGTGVQQMRVEEGGFVASVAGRDVSFGLNIPEAGHIELNIYSMAGQKLISVYNGKVESGKQELHWSAAGLSEGVYLATLVTENSVSTVRLFIK